MIFVAAIRFGRESAVEKRLSLGGLFPGKDVSVARSTVETIILLGVIAPIGLPQVYGNFGADIANVVVSLRHSGLSRADAAALERGYYERSEEHTSELQSLMRISYAVFFLTKKILPTLSTCPTSPVMTPIVLRMTPTPSLDAFGQSPPSSI